VLDSDCNETAPTHVAPEAVQNIATKKNKRWRLRRASDDTLIVDFTIQAGGTYVVTVH